MGGAGLEPEQKEGIEDPIEMERVADANLDQAHTRFICSDDPEEVVDGIGMYVELGFDELVLHLPGPDQGDSLDQLAADVLPLLRKRHRRWPIGSRHGPERTHDLHVGRQPRHRAGDRAAGRPRRRAGGADGEDRRAPSEAPGTVFTAAEEISAAGGEALPIVGDIRDADAVEAAVAQTVERFGGIDVVVNNASAINLAPMRDLEVKRFDLMQTINARGTFVVTRACLPHLRESEHAHVLRSPHRCRPTHAGCAATAPTRSRRWA